MSRAVYHLLAAGLPRRYGVWCRVDGPGGGLLAAAPFTGSRREAEALVRRLNRARTPPRVFREAVLSGALGRDN